MSTTVPMNTRGQRILLWTAPPAAALFALAYLLFPVFSPPLSPTLTPEQVAAFFADNITGSSASRSCAISSRARWFRCSR